jgi:hypothetical protein
MSYRSPAGTGKANIEHANHARKSRVALILQLIELIATAAIVIPMVLA